MNSEIQKISHRSLLFQRNAFLALSGLLSISLIVTTVFLFWKSERIIVVPAVIEKEFWVEPNNVSATYLEQLGYFLGELSLTKSAQSAPLQRAIILRHTDPAFSTELQKKLIEEEKRLDKEKASYVFFPVTVHTDMGRKEVLITGDRTIYVSGKAVSTDRESYLLSFNIQGSRLLLKGITAKEASK
ncbi:MAG: type IV conjugative transfer system protein TraE [Chlamydiales bacterium]